jgi:hypothetical protein
MGVVGGCIILLGKERFGDSGGSNREWYRGYYVAKGKGKNAADAFCARFGPPPGRGAGKGKTDIGWDQL